MDKYFFDGKNLILKDSFLNLNIDEEFQPLQIPDNLKNGLKLSENHIFKVFRFTDGSFEYYILNQGILDGEYILTYPTGQTKHQCFYRTGLLHGPSKIFTKENKILAESWFINGKRNGKFLSYYLSEQIFSHQNFYDDQWHGRQCFWYENGTIKTIMNYVLGEIDGKVDLYHSNGKLKRSLIFDKGNFREEIVLP